MKKLLVALLLVLVMAFSSYAMTPEQFEHAYGFDAQQTFMEINTFGTAEGYVPNNFDGDHRHRRVGWFELHGSGWVTGKGYIVTAAHVVHPSRMMTREEPNLLWEVNSIKIRSRLIMVNSMGWGFEGYEAYVVYENVEQDIAVLRFAEFNPPGVKSIPWPCVATQSMAIWPGTSVGIITRERSSDRSRGWMTEIRWGHVTDVHAKLPKDIPKHELQWFNVYDFTTDLEIYPGDSGSPVVAMVDGKFVVIGVARAAYFGPAAKDERFSYVVRVNPIIHIVRN